MMNECAWMEKIRANKLENFQDNLIPTAIFS